MGLILTRMRQVWNTGMPVWALLLSVMLPIVYVLPSGFIYAMTGQAVRQHPLHAVSYAL